MIEPIINNNEAAKLNMSTEEQNQTDELITNQSELEDIKPLTIGQLIQQRRSDKKLSLKTLAQQTKISLSLLENLESDKIKSLPNKAYVVGFVKTLSKILEIDQNEALATLEYTYNPNVKPAKRIPNNFDNQAAALKNNEKPEDLKGKESILVMQNYITDNIGMFAKIITGVVVFGGIALYISNYIQQIPVQTEVKTESVTETTTQVANTQGDTAAINTAPVVTTETTKEVANTKETTPALVAEVAKTETTDTTSPTLLVKPVELEEKKPLKEVNLSKFESTNVQFEEVDMTTEEYNETLPERFRITQQGSTHNIFINATNGDSWITYKTDNNEIKKFVLRQGRTLFVRGETIRLFLGNPDAVKLFHNSAPVKVRKIGKAAPRNIVVPEEKRADFKQPLFIFQDDGTALTSDTYEQMRASE